MSNAIEVQALTKRFDNKTVLNGVNLKVPDQAIYGFLGNNGAGKSTTIRILLGLLKANAGSVHIWGQSVLGAAPSFKRQIGCLIDSPASYQHLTAREFLSIGQRIKGLPRKAIAQALALVELSDAADHVISTFSLGMKQRIALANALLGLPKLLILDEPTNGLDPQGMADMRNLICSLPRAMGCTVFLSSHLLDEVEKTASHVGIIADGKVKIESPISSLLQQPGVLQLSVSNSQKLLTLLQQQGYNAQITQQQQINIANVQRNDCPALHRLLWQHQIDLYESHFYRHKLVDYFQQGTTTKQEAA